MFSGVEYCVESGSKVKNAKRTTLFFSRIDIHVDLTENLGVFSVKN